MKKRTDAVKPAPHLVTSLEVIEAVHREPIGVVLSIRGKEYRFEGVSLIPAQDRKIADLLNRAMPPRVSEPGKEDRYDVNDPDYRTCKDEFQRTARALAIWWGFPIFREAAEGLKAPCVKPTESDVKSIREFIESRHMDDEVLQALFGALTFSAVRVSELTGFISGNSSPKS